MQARTAALALGLSPKWSSNEDRCEVRDHHAELFEKWKEEHGVGVVGSSLQDYPPFVESIQHLYDYGYSFTDIATFIGVSRERVRQWFRDYDGLERQGGEHGSLYRLWDDDLNCFVPATDDEIVAAYVANKEAARRRHRDRIRASHIHALREIHKRTGAIPRVNDDEVVDAIGFPATHARFWGYPDVSYVEAHDRLWAAAGWPHRPGRVCELNGRHGGARALSDEEVAQVRWAYENTDATQRELAEHFGVGHVTISKVLLRKDAYADVDDK